MKASNSTAHGTQATLGDFNEEVHTPEYLIKCGQLPIAPFKNMREVTLPFGITDPKYVCDVDVLHQLLTHVADTSGPEKYAVCGRGCRCDHRIKSHHT